jgi:hypothetical protein
MSNKHPSQAAIAKALDLSDGRVSQLIAKGMPKYSIEAARAWKAQNIAPTPNTKAVEAPLPRAAPAAPVASGMPSYEQSRAKREAAEAHMAVMKMRELQGDLVSLEAVKRVWIDTISNCRNAMLQIPSRIAPLVAAEPDLATCTIIIENAVHDALEALSSGYAMKQGTT